MTPMLAAGWWQDSLEAMEIGLRACVRGLEGPGQWTVAVALMAGALAWCLAPLLRRPGPPVPAGRDDDDLWLRKEEALQAIRDVDFEHAAGRLSDDEYERLRTEYKREAATLLAALERRWGAGAAGEEPQ